jgi:hypothetical protein
MSHRIANLLTQLDSAMGARHAAEAEARRAREELKLAAREAEQSRTAQAEERAQMMLTVQNLREEVFKVSRVESTASRSVMRASSGRQAGMTVRARCP